jgi:hypothetical protein
MTDLPIRPDVPPSAHPDALGNFAHTLDLPGTPGHMAYEAGRNALAETYRLLSHTADAEAAVQDAAPSARRRQSLEPRHAEFLGPLRWGVNGIERFTGREELLNEAYEKAICRINPLVNREIKNIEAQIGRLETQVAEALTFEGAGQSARSGQATEIRQLLKAFNKDSERWNFMKQRVDAKDKQAIDAVLSSPPYLSGLTDEQHRQLRIIAAEVWCPHQHGQLNACKAMLDRVRVGVEYMGTVRDRLKLNAQASPGTVAGNKLAQLSRA